MRRTIDLIVVHCSATPPSMDVGAAEIHRWHLDRGWRDIGYHAVVRRDGTVEAGRPLDQAGAHVRGHNKHSLGICLIGGVDQHGRPEANFTGPQLRAAALWALARQSENPGAQIFGHRDLDPHKACPSFDVGPWIELTRQHLIEEAADEDPPGGTI
mgnify:CR=1 FL=1